MTDEIRFDDAAAYDRYMGAWSQLVAHEFLNWIAKEEGLRWLDVGCGSGAFTQVLLNRTAPSYILGVDPAPEQIAFARARIPAGSVHFQEGDAMALPAPNNSFDAAVMPLVIFFVPDPARGLAEMARVVVPGGLVAAYAWDMDGGGFPNHALREEMASLGISTPDPPSRDASRLDVMQRLWHAAGLAHVVTRTIEVTRTFASFDEYWETIRGGPAVAKKLLQMTDSLRSTLRERMRERYRPDAAGRITYSARANAIKGDVPQ